MSNTPVTGLKEKAMTLSEEQVRGISVRLNEPEHLQKMRLEALREAGHLPRHELRYGLEIFSETSDSNDAELFGAEIRYKFEKPDGARILSWEEALKDREARDLLAQYFTPGNFPVLKNYYFAAALAGFTSGLVVIVEEDRDISFSFESAVQNGGADMVFVVARPGSKLRFEDVLTTEGKSPFGRTFFVVAEGGAQVEISRVQNSGSESLCFINNFSSVFRGARVSWLDAHFGGGFVKSDIEDFLLEEGASSRIRNISIAGTERFDFYNVSHHKAPHTLSDISARGIAGGGGKIIYRGLVDIGEGCRGSHGRQDGRFLLASAGAEIDAIPSLDIRSSEVSSSHALSISHVKENDLFYPALRGVEAYPAQAMFFEGFLSHDIMSEAILFLIRKKLSSSIYEIS